MRESDARKACWISAYPTNEIVSDRVGPNTFIDADGNVREYAYYIDVRATCYYVGGTTASGLPADESVIAVDPSVISLGTRGVRHRRVR